MIETVIAVAFLIGAVMTVKYLFMDLFNEKKLEAKLKVRQERKAIKAEKKREEHVDGLTINVSDASHPKNQPSETPLKRYVPFGNKWIPERSMTSGMLFLGTTETGKTTMMELVMSSALEKIGKINPNTQSPFPHRAIITDPKGNNAAILASLGVPYRILSPMIDTPLVVEWDLSAEVAQDWTNIKQLASDLYPPREGEKDPFWNNSVRSIARVVLESLDTRRRTQGIEWSFRDFYMLMMTPDYIEDLIEEDNIEHKTIVTNLLKSEVAKNVKSSIIAATEGFSTFANSWDGTKQKFSVAEWTEGHYALILPFDTRHKELFGTIYKIILNKVLNYVCSPAIPDTDKIADLPEGEVPSRYYLFLDEIQNLQKIRELPSAPNLGRSKGLCVNLCFQNLDSIQRQYGKEGMGELLSALKNRAVFQVDGYTAEIVEGWLGDELKDVAVTSVNNQGGISGGSISSSQAVNESIQRQTKKVFSKAKLSTIPSAEFITDDSGRVVGGRGVTGLYFHRSQWEELSTSAVWIDQNAPKKCAQTRREWSKLQGQSTLKRKIVLEELLRLIPDKKLKKQDVQKEKEKEKNNTLESIFETDEESSGNALKEQEFDITFSLPDVASEHLLKEAEEKGVSPEALASTLLRKLLVKQQELLQKKEKKL